MYGSCFTWVVAGSWLVLRYRRFGTNISVPSSRFKKSERVAKILRILLCRFRDRWVSIMTRLRAGLTVDCVTILGEDKDV
jgi:hypothetical protein